MPLSFRFTDNTEQKSRETYNTLSSGHPINLSGSQGSTRAARAPQFITQTSLLPCLRTPGPALLTQSGNLTRSYIVRVCPNRTKQLSPISGSLISASVQNSYFPGTCCLVLFLHQIPEQMLARPFLIHTQLLLAFPSLHPCSPGSLEPPTYMDLFVFVHLYP